MIQNEINNVVKDVKNTLAPDNPGLGTDSLKHGSKLGFMYQINLATFVILCTLCFTSIGSALAAGYVERFGQQVAGTLDIHWELISAPNGIPVGCTAIEFTDGTLADAADGSVTMSGIEASNNLCIGLDNYDFTMAPDGLSLTGFASSVAMTLTRMPGDPSFVGDWVASGYVYRAHIAADPFPVPNYDPTWLGSWAGQWTDLNDPNFLGSVELLIEEEDAQGGGQSLLSGQLTWDCLFEEECGAVQQFSASESGGFAEMDANNLSDIENFTDGQYELIRSADGLSIVAERLDDPYDREIRVSLRRVAAVRIPLESPSIQRAVDIFATRPNALRLELSAGTYAENVDLAPFSARQARTDLVGMGASADETVIDDVVSGVNGSILKTSGAGIDGLLVLDNFTVTGGESEDQVGAGLMIDAGSFNVVVKNCDLRNNTITLVTPGLGSNYAGGNASIWVGGRARFDSCNFTEGNAYVGGGLLVNRADVVVVDSLFENNVGYDGAAITLNSDYQVGGGENAYLIRNRFVGNTATSTGGAIFIGSYSNTRIEESEFTDNSSVQSFATGGAINVISPNSFTVQSSSFIRNETGRVGGAINLSGRGTHLIEDCTFGGDAGEGNGAASAGGAIVIRRGFNANFDVSILNSSFHDNEAPNGGAIAVIETSSSAARINVNASNINLENNRATNYGGAIYIARSPSDTGITTLDNCEFRANTAAIGGGFFHSQFSSSQIQDCLFDGNVALDSSFGGGGIYAFRSLIDLNGVEFRSNNASFGAGALFYESDGSSIQNSRFGKSPGQGNVATGSGGGLYIQSAATSTTGFSLAAEPGMAGEVLDSNQYFAGTGVLTTINNTIFEANSALNGGAISLFSNANVEINSSQFKSNNADQGGAIYQQESDSKIQSSPTCRAYNFVDPDRYCSEFEGNTATNGGSAIQYRGTNNSQVYTTSFLNNSGPSTIELFETGTDLTLESVWMHENEADAIVTRGSSNLTATHVTLTQNGGSGLVGLEQSSLSMFNSIASGNITGGVSSLGSGLINTDCNFDQSANVGSAIDPMLVTNIEGQSHLDMASPAVDACSDLGILDVDLEGRDRVINFSPDAGAFEVNDDIIFKNGFE